MALRQRTVTGTLVKINGSPLVNGTVTFTLTDKLAYTGTHIIVDTPVSVVTDSTGSFSVNLWCEDDDIANTAHDGLEYEVLFPITDNGSSASHTATFSLRYGTTSVNISELINEPENEQPWGWYSADTFGVADGVSLNSWADRSLNGRDLSLATTTTPILKTNQINGLPAVRFNGGSDRGYRAFSSPVTFYDIFLVMKYRGATFIPLNRMCLGDIDSEILVGVGNGTTWQALTNTEYRRNGILQNSASAPGPMNVFDVIHLRFVDPMVDDNDGFIFNGVLNIGNSASSGYPSPVDVAEFILYGDADGNDSKLNAQLSIAEYEAVTDMLMQKYGIV